MKTLCVIPVFNEYNKLIRLIDQIKKNKFEIFNLQYLFINNGSTDNSLILLKKSGIKYLNLKKNKGVGFALMMGFFYAKKYDFDYLIHLAGNGKMNPEQIDRFINLLTIEKYDFVSGSRFMKGSSKKNNPLIRLFLIKSFSIFLSLILRKKISDTTCGFRAFKINIFKNFKKNFYKKELYTYGYEYFSYGKVIKSKNIKFCEVPVSMNYPTLKDYSKIRPVLDWYVIIKYWIKGLIDNNEL
jgi:dolichol-phosphate mannosyltransferase